IGVVLTGVSLGNIVGGTLADRSPSRRLLGLLCALGGASTLATLTVVSGLGATPAVRGLSLLPRTLLLAGAGFGLPTFVLGAPTLHPRRETSRKARGCARATRQPPPGRRRRGHRELRNDGRRAGGEPATGAVPRGLSLQLDRDHRRRPRSHRARKLRGRSDSG